MTEDTICCALKLLALHTDIITLLARGGGGTEAHQLVQRGL